MHPLRFLLIPALSLGGFAATAQDAQEALNLSNLTVQGTARSMGFGNALGSVGGDFGVTSVNPAGLGVYRTSELTITPSLRMNSASSQYQGTTTLDNNTHFNFNNFGIVLTNAPKGKRYERRNWKSVSFAFGMSRLADFNRNYTYQGKNTTSSATQAFEADANQYPSDPVSSDPQSTGGYAGFQSYLLDYDTVHSKYHSIVPYAGGVNQAKIVTQNGHIDEYAISLGGNYKEKLMLGFTLGLPAVNYHYQSTYTESVAAGNNAPNPNNFTSFKYTQTLDVTGGGVNVKLGAIYKITDDIRVGAAFHSPSVYSLTDMYTPNMVSNVGGSTYVLSTDLASIGTNQFSYQFVTPMRAILSGTYILKGIGFITADYEYVSYNSMHFIYPSDDGYGNSYADQQSAMNQSIKNLYQGTSNFRVGAEGLITKFFMARAGFGYYGNPYKVGGLDGSRIDISAGLGFRTQYFFADIALVHSMYKSQFQPYDIDYTYVTSGPAATIPVSTTSFNINNLAATIGFKF